MKKLFISVLLGIAVLNTCCMQKEGMYTKDVKTRYNERVKAIWIPQAAVALKHIEETSESKSIRRIHKQEVTVGSFDGKTGHFHFHLPLSEDQNVELIYEYDEFKELLQESWTPQTTINEDEHATEQDSFITQKPKKNRCCGCCYLPNWLNSVD